MLLGTLNACSTMLAAKAVDFGMRVVKCDPRSKDPNAAGFSDHYDVSPPAAGEPDAALNHYNAYISTKAVSGWHLQPGHIIAIGKDYWVCVSPACDLVPGQKAQIGISGSKNSSIKPFLAIQLHKLSSSVERADVTRVQSFFFAMNSATKLILTVSSGKVRTVHRYGG